MSLIFAAAVSVWVPRISASRWPSSSVRTSASAWRGDDLGVVRRPRASASRPPTGRPGGRARPRPTPAPRGMREERQRRDRLAAEQARQIVEQAERGVLEVGDELGRQRLRLGDAALDRALARAQHDRRRRQADQLERADALVHLRARGAQHAGVDRVDVGAGDGLGVLQEAPQRLVGRFERAAQLLVDPGDRAQVVGRPGRRQVVQTHRGCCPSGRARRCRERIGAGIARPATALRRS